jgi:hypothetical protein
MPNKAVSFFTLKSVDRILEEGGSGSWTVSRTRTLECEFAVCVRNAHAKDVEGREPHHTAFMVGKIADVVPVGKKGRSLAQFSEYALINVPDAWRGHRNPFFYGSLDDLGIDPAKLDWKPMPKPQSRPTAEPMPIDPNRPIGPLTMAEAKAGLALTFGVKPEAIEITVRG